MNVVLNMKRMLRYFLAAALVVAGLTITATPAQAAPSNDMFANAQAISGPADGNNIDATMEAGEYDYGGDMGASVWFTYTPSFNGDVWLDTCNSDFDTILAVWENQNVLPTTSDTPTEENDDAPISDCGIRDGSSNYGSQLRMTVTSGTAYHIQVGGFINDGVVDQGTFALNLFRITAATNNDFADVQTFTGSSASGSNFDATMQAGEYDADGFIGADGKLGASVWFRFTASRTQEVILNTCDSQVDTVLVVWENPASLPLATDTPLALNDDSETCDPRNGLGSEVRFAVEQGEIYFVQVGGYATTGDNPSEGTFTLAFGAAESSDEGDQTPPMWMQSVGRPADGLCDETQGWVSTWEQWMNDGSGGPTCYRVIAWHRGGWAVGNLGGPNGTFIPVEGASIDGQPSTAGTSGKSKDGVARK